ncbi:MAG: carboxypeptidase-like regulatory domain-containing protein [Planctomycetota bacterium]|nr:carboxypeptidase-like regulatory domain-containing protein [Planctomycetota bacterium]
MAHAEDHGPAEDLADLPEVEGATISGVVTDFDNVPLVGVRVEAATSGGADLDLLPVLTDVEGRFQVEGLAEGRYDLRFLLGRVKARTLAVPVGTDQLRVRLARPQGLLLVTRTEPGAEPPDLVHFVLERSTPNRTIREHFGRTLKRRLLLWSIRPGKYTLTAWGGPYLPVVVPGVEVVESMPAPEVEVLFAAVGGTIEGQVMGAAGEPRMATVAWRRLDAAGHMPRHLTTQSTDEQGRFLMRGFPSGRYVISAWDGAQSIVDVEVDVEDEKTQSAQLTLP